MPANIISFAYLPFGDDFVECASMILYIKPVPDLITPSIYRERLAFQCI